MAVLFPAYWECESGELQKEKKILILSAYCFHLCLQ